MSEVKREDVMAAVDKVREAVHMLHGNFGDENPNADLALNAIGAIRSGLSKLFPETNVLGVLFPAKDARAAKADLMYRVGKARKPKKSKKSGRGKWPAKGTPEYAKRIAAMRAGHKKSPKKSGPKPKTAPVVQAPQPEPVAATA